MVYLNAQPEEQFLGQIEPTAERPGEFHRGRRTPRPTPEEFFYNAHIPAARPEETFFTGVGRSRLDGLDADLLVIEGLDQPIGPYESDYRPDLVPWVTKPSTNHYMSYRKNPKGPHGGYWGPGVQDEPGFVPARRKLSVDEPYSQADSRYTIPPGLTEWGRGSDIDGVV